ncbi:hypothetical protein [Saccharococcus sp. Marseille-Q5394]|uniref:hypothetical protein n=1 Tax=Saccharococcus sp. Marseille-Q5394 TaxID=2972778 RepID=UPI0021C8B812|nr:hypothetical protein [Saccharococcus sp. Marseille-Q5394]
MSSLENEIIELKARNQKLHQEVANLKMKLKEISETDEILSMLEFSTDDTIRDLLDRYIRETLTTEEGMKIFNRLFSARIVH